MTQINTGRRRPRPGFRPVVEAMETRTLLSAARPLPSLPAIGPRVAASPTSWRGAWLDARTPIVTTAQARRIAAVPAGSAHRRALPVLSPEAQEAKAIITRARTQYPREWQSMLARLRRDDPAAWRALSAATAGREPSGWVAGLTAIRSRYPDTPGLPPANPPRPRLPAPGTLDAAPTIGLPLGPRFDLGTRSVDITPDFLGSFDGGSIAMAGNSYVLAAPANSPNLYLYDPYRQSWTLVWNTPIPTTTIKGVAVGSVEIATGTTPSSVQVWMVTQDFAGQQSATRITMRYNSSGVYDSYDLDYSQVALPGGQPFGGIASAGDGTTWAWAAGGAVPYQFSFNGSGSWSARSNQQYGGGQIIGRIDAMAVGSAGQVYLTGSPPGNPQVQYTYRWWATSTGGYWGNLLDGANVVSIAATPDGALFASANGLIYVRTPDESGWLQPPGLGPAGLGAIAAGSKYRLAMIAPQGRLILTTYGLADQPATGYAAWAAGTTQQAAYDAINQQLGFTRSSGAPERSWGIRQQYNNEFSVYDLALYPAQILSMTKPSGVTTADWNTVRSQLVTELTSVLAVYRMFDELNALNTQVGIQASLDLSTAGGLVQLSTPSQSSSVTLALDAIFEAALAGMASAAGVDVSAGGVVGSIVASGIDSAVNATAGQDATLTTTYLGLQQQLGAIFSGAQQANSGYKGAILADPGRFLAVGAGIRDGSLYWPVGSNQTLAKATSDGFMLYFLQALAPIQWDLLQVELTAGTDYLPGGLPAGGYAIVNDPSRYANPMLFALGTTDEYQDPTAFASAQLMNTIFRLTGMTAAQFLTNPPPAWKFEVAPASYPQS